MGRASWVMTRGSMGHASWVMTRVVTRDAPVTHAGRSSRGAFGARHADARARARGAWAVMTRERAREDRSRMRGPVVDAVDGLRASRGCRSRRTRACDDARARGRATARDGGDE